MTLLRADSRFCLLIELMYFPPVPQLHSCYSEKYLDYAPPHLGDILILYVTQSLVNLASLQKEEERWTVKNNCMVAEEDRKVKT